MNRHVRRLLLVTIFTVLATRAAGAPPDPAPASKPIIARIWRGRTLAAKADEYEKYLSVSGIAKIRATPGNLGVTVLRRADGEKTEFLVMSLWESFDAIKKFAGEDYQKAVLLPRDREYLLEVENNVLHYEVKREERRP
jgi:heme-degrading monooxygenase HmoA